jgi:tetratricopeptide (TPR) repeat protein
MRNGFSITIIIALMTSQLIAREPAKLQCNPSEISKSVFNGDLDAALKITQVCIDAEKQDLERISKESPAGSPGIVDVVGLSETVSGALFVAKPEILALRGDFSDADSALAEADHFDQQHSGSGMTWDMTGAPLAVAHAFLLERRGNLREAEAAYNAIFTAAVKSGWGNVSTVVNGRLALIALARGDDASAERWIKPALSSDPGANVAMAIWSERKANHKAAKEYYAAALKLMSDAAKGNNWSLPVYFAEQKRAKDGLAK